MREVVVTLLTLFLPLAIVVGASLFGEPLGAMFLAYAAMGVFVIKLVLVYREPIWPKASPKLLLLFVLFLVVDIVIVVSQVRRFGAASPGVAVVAVLYGALSLVYVAWVTGLAAFLADRRR